MISKDMLIDVTNLSNVIKNSDYFSISNELNSILIAISQLNENNNKNQTELVKELLNIIFDSITSKKKILDFNLEKNAA